MTDDCSIVSPAGAGPDEPTEQAGLAAGILRSLKLRWFRGFGHADLESKTPVTRDTAFHLAPLTKTSSAARLLQLVEQAKHDLNTAAAEFGIELENQGSVTLQHLLTHRSGDTGSRPRTGNPDQQIGRDSQ